MTEGFAIIPNWMTRDPNVTALMRAVYVTLSGHIGRGETWEISHGCLAEETGLSISTVKRTLTALRDLGVIDWTTDSDSQRDGRGSRYRLTYPLGHRGTTPQVTPDLPPRSPVSDKRRTLEKNPENRRSRGSRLPDSFEPTTELLAWADSKLIPRGFVMHETDQFVDYWLAATGARAVKADWAAAWRNWIRRGWDRDGDRWKRLHSTENPENWR